MDDYKHIFRAVLLLITFLVFGAIVRAALVPDSFGKYGPYRGDHLDEERFATPVLGSDDDCLECHETEWDMADGRHAYVPCADCHFLSIPHAKGKRREIENIMQEYARNASELAFGTLYTVMSKGWKRKDIGEIVEKLNDNDLGMKIRVFRGDPVIRQFGDIEEERAIREEDPDILKALREGKDILMVQEENTVRYIYPILVKTECLDCHIKAKEGDINGVIDVTFPVELAITPELGKPKQIIEIAYKDARHASKIVFQSLYSVMRRGWDKEKTNELVNRLNKNNMNMVIRLFRGTPVIDQFGEITGEREFRESDPSIMRALRVGNDILLEDDPKRIRYIYPIKTAKECITCHTGVEADDVLGAIEVNFELKRLTIQGLQKLADMPIDRSQRACAICHSHMPSRPVKFPQVKDFSKHFIDNWKKKMGLVDEEASCMRCHKAHMPRIVKKAQKQ